MIDRHAVAIVGDEDAGSITDLVTKLVEHRAVRARRDARERDARSMVEHHAARALEVAPVELVVREVDKPCHLETALLDELVQPVRAAFKPAASAPASDTARSSRRRGKLTQLLGNTASGQRGGARSSIDVNTSTPPLQ